MQSTLYSKTMGSGQNVVLIHGLGVHSGFWEPIIHQLAGDFCVTTIDLPGCGQSLLASDFNYDLPNLAKQILLLAPPKAIWLGWSLGGLIATFIAANFLERVEKLICVASSPKFIKSAGWPGMKESFLNNIESALYSISEDMLLRFLSLQFKNALINRRDKQKMRNELFQYGLPHNDALQGGLEIIRQTDLREQVATLNCPILYVLGKLDVLVPCAIAGKLDELLATGYIHIFPRGCHAPFLSSTTDFIRTFYDFAQNYTLQPIVSD